MNAIILAGGLGARLADAVPNLPKVMAPIAGVPFLSYVLRSIAEQGFKKARLSVGHMADPIEKYFGDNFAGMELSYSKENAPLGTGGAIRLTLQSDDVTGPVLVLNGDTLASTDYRGMLKQHETAPLSLSVALVEVPDTARYGAVEVADNRITTFMEKGRSGPGLINSGAYVMDKSFFDEFEHRFGALPERFSFENEILTKHSDRLAVRAFLSTGYFIDIGVPADYQRAQIELQSSLP